MRHAFFLLSLALMCLAFSQAEAKNPYSTSPRFGSAYCPKTFSCAMVTNRDTARAVSGELVTLSNQCVAQRLNLRDPKGYFESSFGLDNDLCLTTKKLTKATSGLTMTPYCCVKPTKKDPNKCQVVCTQYGVH